MQIITPGYLRLSITSITSFVHNRLFVINRLWAHSCLNLKFDLPTKEENKRAKLKPGGRTQNRGKYSFKLHSFNDIKMNIYVRNFTSAGTNNLTNFGFVFFFLSSSSFHSPMRDCKILTMP